MPSLPPLPEDLAQRVEVAKGEHDPDLVDRLVEGIFEGDPTADRLLSAFDALPGGSSWRMLDEALEHGPESVEGAPPALADLLAPAMEPPEWVDFDRIEAGALAYWRSGGLPLGLALACGSLAYGYQSARLTRPLAATGRLERMAPRRLRETSRWVGLTTAPGALQPGGVGIRATLRLRLVHALIRRHLLADPDWDRDEWGVPISATDSVVTAIGGFMTVPVRALRDLGFRFSRTELEAMTHQWGWVASLMGVPDRLIPRSYEEAHEMMELAIELDGGPNEDSSKLMRALLYEGVRLPFESRLGGPLRPAARAFKARYFGGFARRWMGDEMADRLGIPGTPMARLVPLLRPLAGARELVRATNLLGSDERIVRLERAFAARISGAGESSIETISPEHVAEEPVLSAA